MGAPEMDDRTWAWRSAPRQQRVPGNRSHRRRRGGEQRRAGGGLLRSPGSQRFGCRHRPLDAVRILRDSDQPICAVVTDIRMPRMDGFELIRFMRADRRHAATPIIVVTADTDPETPERASSLGADAFFSKPFSPAAIRRTLGELLHETRLSR